MVDDRVDGLVGVVGVAQLGDPLPDVVALGVELAALGDRVEDAEVRRGVGAAARRPLPAVLVGGEVAVDQPLHEVARAVLPLDVQVLDQEARHDHPHPVVHPPGRAQLAHAGVDDGEAGAALPPRGELVARLVVRHPLELGPQVVARGLRVVEQHVGVELPPGELLAVGRRALAGEAAQVVQHRARVDLAPLEVHRHVRGGVEVGPVALAVVVLELLAPVLPPASSGGLLAGRRQAEVVGERLVGHAVGVGDEPAHRTQVAGRFAPAVLLPGAAERREDLVRRPVALGHPARRHGVRRPGADELDVVLRQGRVDALVASAAVRTEVRGDVHPVGPDLARRADDLGHRVAGADGQPDAGVQVAQRLRQVVPPRRPARPPQGRVEDEQGEHVTVPVGGVEQGGVVREAQVAPEPHDCWHCSTLPALRS